MPKKANCLKIHLKELTLTSSNLEEVLKLPKLSLEWEESLMEVIREWFGNQETISFYTSGSTGKPKKIEFSKKQVEASAKLTANTFNLSRNSRVLLCLHPKYVAAKMMILRTIINEWELTIVEPTKIPEIAQDYDFSAMVPMQVSSSIETNFELLNRIKTIIIGGAPISEKLHRKILKLENECYATYGMTETLTHVAIQRMNGSEAAKYFTKLKGVELNQDKNNCLNIQADHLGVNKIQTNDVVKFVDLGKFIWLGRIDNVINSGGVKIHPEIVEKKIQKLIDRRLIITKEKDKILGQKVVLVIEGEKYDSITLNLLENHLQDVLSKYEIPKEIVFVPKMEETFSGKIIRKLITKK